MKRLNKFLPGLAALAILLTTIFMPMSPAYAADPASTSESCQTLNSLRPGTQCNQGNAKSTLGSVIGSAVRILAWVVGIISVIMIILGGFRFVLSGGDATKVKNARSTIVYALVGLLLAALAQVIVNVLVSRAS